MCIMKKISKLMKKAKDSASTPEESALFLAKAQGLMLEHKISLSELEDHDEPLKQGIRLNTEDASKKKVAYWKKYLAAILCKHNGCFIFQSGNKLSLAGKESNLRAVEYLYKYCLEEIDRITKLNTKGLGRTYANNFRYGCVDAIRDAMKEEIKAKREHYAKNEKALVVLDNVLVEAQQAETFVKTKVNLRTSNAKSGRAHNGARQHGRDAGANIYGPSRRAIT